MKSEGIIGIETSKFVIPLSQKIQNEYNKKVNEYCEIHEFVHIPSPVS
jgi:hypothetical protein